QGCSKPCSKPCRKQVFEIADEIHALQGCKVARPDFFVGHKKRKTLLPLCYPFCWMVFLTFFPIYFFLISTLHLAGQLNEKGYQGFKPLQGPLQGSCKVGRVAG